MIKYKRKAYQITGYGITAYIIAENADKARCEAVYSIIDAGLASTWSEVLIELRVIRAPWHDQSYAVNGWVQDEKNDALLCQ